MQKCLPSFCFISVPSQACNLNNWNCVLETNKNMLQWLEGIEKGWTEKAVCVFPRFCKSDVLLEASWWPLLSAIPVRGSAGGAVDSESGRVVGDPLLHQETGAQTAAGGQQHPAAEPWWPGDKHRNHSVKLRLLLNICSHIAGKSNSSCPWT